MKVLKEKEIENEKYYSKQFVLDDNVQINSLMEIARSFENDQVMMSVCDCDTYDTDSTQIHLRYGSIDQLANLNSAPSPYISFYLEYVYRDTLNYAFDLRASVNSNLLTYIVDKKKLGLSEEKGMKMH